jgi:hypothetical protein
MLLDPADLLVRNPMMSTETPEVVDNRNVAGPRVSAHSCERADYGEFPRGECSLSASESAPNRDQAHGYHFADCEALWGEFGGHGGWFSDRTTPVRAR